MTHLIEDPASPVQPGTAAKARLRQRRLPFIGPQDLDYMLSVGTVRIKSVDGTVVKLWGIRRLDDEDSVAEISIRLSDAIVQNAALPNEPVAYLFGAEVIEVGGNLTLAIGDRNNPSLYLDMPEIESMELLIAGQEPAS